MSNNFLLWINPSLFIQYLVSRMPLVFLLAVSPHALAQEQPMYLNTTHSFEERAADLVSHMTLGEKVPQLINDAPAIPRLGVREYNWWNEGLHGVAALGEATVFPQAIGMAATWDDSLMLEIADVISTEFRAKHYANQHRFGGSAWFGGLTVWSPNINIFRDPRWGRGQETYGEDPYLTSRLGVAFVKGLQGEDPNYLKTVATPKHYAVHSGPEASRHRDDIHTNQKDLEETYLPAFRATIVEADAQSIMCAYNAVNGVPACANTVLLKDILRKEWDFNGVVVSDCGAVFDVYHENNHAYTQTPEEGMKAVFDAGLDLICGDAKEANYIHSAIKKGLITEKQIDEILVRLFTARMRLGQFDPRHEVFPKITAAHNDTDEHRQFARKVAEKSLVLLKNHNNFLPFKDDIKKLAVIGPNADSWDALVGNYNGTPSQPVTVLKGLRERFGEDNILYSPGTSLLDAVQEPVPAQAICVDAKCKRRGLKAEYYADKNFSGEPLIKRVDETAQIQWRNEVRSGAVRWTGYLEAPETGPYSLRYVADGGYRIWIDNNLVIDGWNVDWRPTIASGYINLAKGKRYALRIEAFQRGEQGNEEFVWSVPSDPGAERAVKIAEESDAIVFVGGLSAKVEGEEIPIPVPGFVGGDRIDINLPSVQRKLLQRLYATGKPVVVVLMNGSALAVNEANKSATAIIEAWYPGGQGGEAVAALLAGDFSPAGRLPVTFYKSVEQLPDFGDYSMQDRTYRYFSGEVLYPFGFGLSYSEFAYSNVKVTPSKWAASGKVTVSVDVKNTGAMDADEVVQLYLSRNDIENSPLRSLVGFKRVHIPGNATRKVSIALDKRQLSTVDENGERAIVPGKVELWIGGGQPGLSVNSVSAPGEGAYLVIKKGGSL